MTSEQIEQVRSINDAVRKESPSYLIYRSAMGLADQAGLYIEIVDYDGFDETDKDDLHDSGLVEWNGVMVRWDIEYPHTGCDSYYDPTDPNCLRIVSVALD